jgi:acyl-CoA hydrolase
MPRSSIADHLRSGDHVVVGQATAEPVGLVEDLLALAGRVEPLHVFCGYSLNPAWNRPIDPALRVGTYCGLGTIRQAVGQGTASVVPAQMSQLVAYFACGRLRCDVVLLQVSPADEQGWHSLGCAVDYVWAAAERARVVLVEINPNVPQTRSVHRLHASRVTVACRSEQPLLEVPDEARDERQLAIGRHVARLVPDGAIVQLGIGGLAAAVARGLSGHRGLKVRSGMVGDWFLELVASGAIDADDQEACMASLAAGSRQLYAACGPDSLLRFVPQAQLVAPEGAAAALPFMAINSAIEVDLAGQANAEYAGNRYVGAVSAQPDYFRAARRSPGGLAILTLPAATGREPKSRIVARLPGAHVTSAQSDIDVIVTEHGVADLRATTLAQRRRLIAQLAAPQFRAALADEAFAGRN